jgi:hypothetical protein
VKTFTSYNNDITRIIGNTDLDTAAWCKETLMDSLRYLTTKYYFNERTYTVPGGTIAQTQFYNLPPQVKKLINVTVTIGSVLWQPKECPSKVYWDYLNSINFFQDYPSYFFVWNGQVGIFPIPASNNNVMTLNYKTRILDLSMADVTDVSTAKTMAITTNTTLLTASGNVFVNWMAGNWIRIPYSNTNANSGDNQWYQIASITSPTQAVLKNQYTGATVTAGAFTIGETPILPEDYQDLPLWRMASIYYTTRVADEARAKMYTDFYDKGVALLDDEFGSKTTNVVLTDTSEPVFNPNLYQSHITQN